jgi:hypothetical protein
MEGGSSPDPLGYALEHWDGNAAAAVAGAHDAAAGAAATLGDHAAGNEFIGPMPRAPATTAHVPSVGSVAVPSNRERH